MVEHNSVSNVSYVVLLVVAICGCQVGWRVKQLSSVHSLRKTIVVGNETELRKGKQRSCML